MTDREQAEHIRQEIIRALMLEGMTRAQAEAAESRRFQRAITELFNRAPRRAPRRE